MSFNLEYLKATIGFSTATAAWGASHLAQAVDQLPPWVKTLDTPLVVIGLGYGIVHLWRELKRERDARIKDNENFINRLDQRDARTEESRNALLKATLDQTAEFKALRREIGRKGLHVSSEGED